MGRRRGSSWIGTKGRGIDMIDAQQVSIPWPILGAVVTASVSVVIFVVSNWLNGVRDRHNRSREVFSRAFASVQEYKEYPYVIRRRRTASPEEERIRISSELQRVQSDLAFYSAWLQTESPHVHRKFAELLTQVRTVAGGAMREAWLESVPDDDSAMNMPDLGYAALKALEDEYLEEVIHHLSLWPRWLRQMI